MTDFNAAFRTQAWMGEQSMQRQQMDQQLQMQDRQVAASLPSMSLAFRQQRLAERQSQFQEEMALVSMQEQASRREFEQRAFDRRSAFEDEQLAMAREQQGWNQRQGAADMEIKRTLAEAQVADYEAQAQLNQQRAMQMSQLDQMELSRLSVEQERIRLKAAEMQFESARLELEERRSTAGTTRQRFDLEAKRIEADIYGDDPSWFLDSATGKWRPSTDDERKQREKALRMRRTAYQDNAFQGNREYPLNTIQESIAARAQGWDYTVDEETGLWKPKRISPEEQKKAQEQYDAMVQKSEQQAEASLRRETAQAALRTVDTLLTEQRNLVMRMEYANPESKEYKLLSSRLEAIDSELADARQRASAAIGQEAMQGRVDPLDRLIQAIEGEGGR